MANIPQHGVSQVTLAWSTRA